MRAPTTHTTARALGWVTAGAMTANICAYLVHVPASRWLTEADYGEFAVVLAWLLVVAVPALACQAVVAREAVRGVADSALRALGIRLSGVVAAVAIVVAPVVSALTDISLDAVLPGVLVAPMLTLIATGQGVLQGRGRFAVLGVVLAVTGFLRSVPMVVAIAAGFGVDAALWAGLVGAATAAAVVWAVTVRAEALLPVASASGPGLWSVLAASQVQLALVVASSLDLLLSRTVLGATDAGIYAVGAVALKVAFWLPQAVGVVFYPSMADVRRTRRSVRGAVVVVSAIGAVLIVAAAIGGSVVPAVLGEKYRAVVGLLWLFTYTGVVLSLLQILLLATIAARRTRWSLIAWAVIIVEVVAIWFVADSVASLLIIAAASATAATILYGVTVRLWSPSDQRHDAGNQGENAEDSGDQRDDASPHDLRP